MSHKVIIPQIEVLSI